MDVAVRRIGYWLFSVVLVSFCVESVGFAAPQQVADASEGGASSASDDEDAGVEKVVGSLLTMASLQSYSYGAI